MIELSLDSHGLTLSRFALSAVGEAINSLEALLRPSRAPYLRTWATSARSRVDPARIDLLAALARPSGGYVPDFITPVPSGYEPGLEEELAGLVAVAPKVVQAELALAYPGSLPSRVGRELDRGGAEALTQGLVEQLRYYVATVLVDVWPTARRALDGDVRDRAAAASRNGSGTLIAGLHPSVSWDGRHVQLAMPFDVAADARAGLVLTPSLFMSRPTLCLGTGRTPILGYPANGRGALWGPRATPTMPPALLGPQLLALLDDLDLPRTTTELAVRHQRSPSTISYHLGRSVRAGLLSRRREGLRVLYQRTSRGDDLLATTKDVADSFHN